MKKLLAAGLEATAALWPAIALLYAWVYRVAHLLGAKGPGTAAQARRQLGGLLGAMMRHRAALGPLVKAALHFLKVTRSSWAGLFHG